MIVKGRYDLIECVARGAMGAVWRARDLDLDGRVVAVKMLHDSVDGAGRTEHRQRLERESRTLTRLSDPRLVDIRDHGDHEGQPFLVMEYVEGRTMASIIARGPRLSLEASLRVIEDLCDGVHSAHLAGVVHRDIKPANIIIDVRAGTLKVVDFGLARTTDTSLSREGTLTGTLNYMSPEQVLGDPGLDHRSDVFAIGAVCYELLSGRQAFPGDIKSGLLTRILDDHPPSLDAVSPDIPADLVRIVTRALQKRPVDRYQTLSEMALEVRRIRDRLALGRVTSETTVLADPIVLDHRVATAWRCLQDGDVADAARLVTGVLQADAEHAGALEVRRRLLALEREAWRRELGARARRATVPLAAAAVAAALVGALTIWSSLFSDGPPDGAVADIELVPIPGATDVPIGEAQPLEPGVPPSDPTDDPAPATATAGLLAIDALPWAEVVAVRNAQGQIVAAGEYTPVALPLPPGTYTVDLRRAGITRTQSVAVDESGIGRVHVEFTSIDLDAYFARSIPP